MNYMSGGLHDPPGGTHLPPVTLRMAKGLMRAMIIETIE